ncbi:MAG: hypothetical protein WCJ64_00600 [Rhodospirillaceae bacterium]
MAHVMTTEERAAAVARDAALVDAVIAAMPAVPSLKFPPLSDLPAEQHAAEHARRCRRAVAAEMAEDDAAAAAAIITAIEAVGIAETSQRVRQKKRLMIFVATMLRLWPSIGDNYRRRHFTDPAKNAFGLDNNPLEDRWLVYCTVPRATPGRSLRRERLPHVFATAEAAQAWIDAQPARSDRTYEVSRPIKPGRKPKS